MNSQEQYWEFQYEAHDKKFNNLSEIALTWFEFIEMLDIFQKMDPTRSKQIIGGISVNWAFRRKGNIYIWRTEIDDSLDIILTRDKSPKNNIYNYTLKVINKNDRRASAAITAIRLAI